MNRNILLACPVLLVALTAGTPRAAAQPAFDPPPAPQADPRVKGLYDPFQTPGGPTNLNSPAATFMPPAAAARPTAPAVTPVDAQPLAGGEIVARIDGQVVLAGDVMWQVDQLLEMNKDRIPPDQIDGVRQMILRQQVLALIETKLLMADFRRNVPADNMKEIDKQLAKPFEDVEVPRLLKMTDSANRVELEQRLQASGAALKDIQRQFVERTVAAEWMKQKTPKSKPITREQMDEYYRAHQSEYDYPAKVRWEELMVRFDRFGGDREAAWAALAEMGNDVWTQVVLNPEMRGPVFGAVAKAKSHGFTAHEGGVHDWETLGALKCDGLNEALATLEPGRMSDGIESELGFHIVRVLDRKEAGRTSFTEAQAEIRKTLETEQRMHLAEEELGKLMRSARVWTAFDGEIRGAQLEEMLEARRRR
ncbi:MAG: peptidyl-prolyl cis-trans isomerase [Planctomycetales bacterium]|nr:peptidyl-prolyl cis-trans isomerase [Planctomycetales bacterium]